MQGRLSPPVPGRLQTFPWHSWEAEFAHARACGFDAIEWLFEEPDARQNPLWTEAGRERIRRAIADSGIAVRSVCADYFMTHAFFRTSADARTAASVVLEQLIRDAADVGIRTVLLPVLETAEIRTAGESDELLRALQRPLAIAAAEGVSIALETELPAPEYHALVADAAHPALGVYYDVGNATAKGFDAAADLRALAPWLRGVHIKDRRRGGPSVPLGQGDADFAAVFQALAAAGYDGPVVVQAAMGHDHLELARGYATFVKEHLCRAATASR
jgi:hexulose-6-phosphate isomerase